jgi:hypothetical protein
MQVESINSYMSFKKYPDEVITITIKGDFFLVKNTACVLADYKDRCSDQDTIFHTAVYLIECPTKRRPPECVLRRSVFCIS